MLTGQLVDRVVFTDRLNRHFCFKVGAEAASLSCHCLLLWVILQQLVPLISLAQFSGSIILTVQADPIPFQQIIANLISNALKYTPAGTSIEISAQGGIAGPTTKKRGMPQEMVEILVRDFGPGIPPDQIPLLFHRFVRLPRDLGSNVTGTGLGLYLCQNFAEAMGGNIWVESTGEAGEGATFHLHLARSAVEAPPARTSVPLQKLGVQ